MPVSRDVLHWYWAQKVVPESVLLNIVGMKELICRRELYICCCTCWGKAREQPLANNSLLGLKQGGFGMLDVSQPCPSHASLAPSPSPPWPSMCCIHYSPCRKAGQEVALGLLIEMVLQRVVMSTAFGEWAHGARSEVGSRVQISHIWLDCDCFPLHIL